MNEQLADLRKELNETKSQIVVAEYKRETDIQNLDRKAHAEISSLQHLVHGKHNFDFFNKIKWFMRDFYSLKCFNKKLKNPYRNC